MKTEILWNWKKRADTILRRHGYDARGRVRDDIARALQKAYQDGRKSLLPRP